MTSPANPTGASDAPVASVGIGLSEIVAGLGILSSLLVAMFGQDWGVHDNIQQLAELVAGLIVVGTSVSRALKHRGAMHANALVYAAQLQHAVTALSTGVSVTSLNQAVKTLNANVPDPDPAVGAKRARKKDDAGEGLLGIIGVILLVVGLVLLILGAVAHPAYLSVGGVILTAVGLVLAYFDTRGSLRL